MNGSFEEAIHAAIKAALGKIKIDFREWARAPDTMAVYRTILKMSKAEDFPRGVSAEDMEKAAVHLLEMSQWGYIEIEIGGPRMTWAGLIHEETVVEDDVAGVLEKLCLE